ncbi:hypothetical protein Tco_1184770 [Tanacetum coccineum]
MGKFLMYPRFVQVFLDTQVDGMSKHTEIFVTPSQTKKVFRNMKRVGKGFSGVVTPLFPTMMVQAQEEMGKADEAVYEERDDSLERAATTATSLDAEEERGNIAKTQSKATLNEPSSIGTSSGSGPRCQDTMGDTIAQTRVLDLENTKTAQAQEITSLKKRVKKLKRRKKSRTHGFKRLYNVGLSVRIDSLDDKASLGDQEDASKQGRKIHDIDEDEDITLASTHYDTDPDMFGVNDLDGDEVFVETEELVVNAATTTSTIPVSVSKDLSDVDITLAQVLYYAGIGYLRKGQKLKPKRQNRAREWRDREKSKS